MSDWNKGRYDAMRVAVAQLRAAREAGTEFELKQELTWLEEEWRALLDALADELTDKERGNV